MQPSYWRDNILLQLIGLLGCIYLFVKGLELYDKRDGSALPQIGGVIAILGSIVFIFLFLVISTSGPSPY